MKSATPTSSPSSNSPQHASGPAFMSRYPNPEMVFQGAFLSDNWGGWSDFLERVETLPSALGMFSYEVADTKLKRCPHPKHVLQLIRYLDLLVDVNIARSGNFSPRFMACSARYDEHFVALVPADCISCAHSQSKFYGYVTYCGIMVIIDGLDCGIMPHGSFL